MSLPDNDLDRSWLHQRLSEREALVREPFEVGGRAGGTTLALVEREGRVAFIEGRVYEFCAQNAISFEEVRALGKSVGIDVEGLVAGWRGVGS